MRRDERTIFVGDVHGCCAELDALLAKVSYAPGRDRLLLTGDAFTRGPDPLGVWQRIRGSGAEMVMGNHDDALLGQLRTVAAGRDPKPAYGDRNETLRALAPQGEELIAWLAALPLYIEEPGFLLVHAGIDPERGLAGTSRDQFLTIRTWPPDGGISGPRWHDHLDERHLVPGRPIVFGHDAPAGPAGQALSGGRERRPARPDRPRLGLRVRQRAERLSPGRGPHRPGPRRTPLDRSVVEAPRPIVALLAFCH